ncbi:MAG: radical SAM protein [Lachnospiraceae bacterium]|jgi:organic radical activating enzyme|nr:radical SAM protein [Lachnospiraceae bacterium]
MKWRNKGHEFDGLYTNMMRKERFYLFGAGDYGQLFFKIMKNEIEIISFIDNDPQKKSNSCITLEQLDQINEESQLDDKTGIILTMSQIARMSAVKQLNDRGYQKDIDFFVMEEFMSVYYVDKYDQVYMTSISFLPSTICNLKCRHCLNFNPFAKQFYVREWEDLVRDVDLFFESVDRLMIFHLSGGEPLLYQHTADLLGYIYEHYGDRIDRLRTVTNGTVVPEDKVLEKLCRYPIEVTVDDYLETVPQYSDQFKRLIEKLEQYKIRYVINKAESWIDLAPEKTDYSQESDEWLERHASECEQTWQELRDGKLYSCNYAAYAVVARVLDGQDHEETYDLKQCSPSNKKELIEFRLGYNDKGFTEFCKRCRGFNQKDAQMVIPALQVDAPFYDDK